MYKEPFLLIWAESSEYREDSAEKRKEFMFNWGKYLINYWNQIDLNIQVLTLCGVVVLALQPLHRVGGLLQG